MCTPPDQHESAARGMASKMWDERFRSDTFAYGCEPSRWLTAQSDWLRPGMRALVPADGEGRNGVWLARQGLDVHSVDFSIEGLTKSARFADTCGVELQTEHADLLAWTWPERAYDLVAAVFFHCEPVERRRLHRSMAEALRPGGRLLLESFHTDQLGKPSGGPADPALLHDLALLQEDFSALNILHLERVETTLDEGSFHQGPAVLVHLLAERAFRDPGENL